MFFLISDCQNYEKLDDFTRNVIYGQQNSDDVYNYHDSIANGGKNSSDWKGPDKWYRFVGAAGTQMPENSPGYKRCGTYGSG